MCVSECECFYCCCSSFPPTLILQLNWKLLHFTRKQRWIEERDRVICLAVAIVLSITRGSEKNSQSTWKQQKQQPYSAVSFLLSHFALSLSLSLSFSSLSAKSSADPYGLTSNDVPDPMRRKRRIKFNFIPLHPYLLPGEWRLSQVFLFAWSTFNIRL